MQLNQLYINENTKLQIIIMLSFVSFKVVKNDKVCMVALLVENAFEAPDNSGE